MKDCGSRLFRQKLELMDYNFKIMYRPGAQNHVADALSRIKPISIEEMLEKEKGNEILNEEKCFVQTRGQVQKDIDKALEIPEFKVEERDGTLLNKRGFDLIFYLVPSENDRLKESIMNKYGITNFTDNFHNFNRYHYVKLISNQFANRNNEDSTLKCINEISGIVLEKKARKVAINLDYDNIRHYIYFKNILEEIFLEKFVVAEQVTIQVVFFLNNILELTERDDIEKIMKLYHESVLGGHVGGDRMYKTISKFYKWHNMADEIRNYVKKCTICEKTKTFTNTKIPLEVSSLGESLFDHTYIDFVGPISITPNGNRFILTMVCDLTKMLVCCATKDSTALTTAKCLIEHIFCRYNFPSRLISDNAKAFLSQVIKEITTLFAIKKVFCTPYHAMSNVSERSHRNLGSYLRAYTEQNRDDWDEMLMYASFSYNNTIHTTTGYTPHELAHGFRIKIPSHMTRQKLTYNYDNFADKTRNDIAKALEIAKEHLINKQLQNKKYYDEKTAELNLEVGDLVLIKNMVKSHKFDNVYDGPFQVTDVWDSYIEIMKNGVKTKIHKNLVKKSRIENIEEN